MNKDYTESGRTQQKLKTRNKILSSAKKLLMKGEDFSLEDVAEDIAISRATIYRYYSSVEVLSREAGLELNTKSPEAILKPLKGLPLLEQIKGIQTYFNNLTFSNEDAFRKYLSVAIVHSSVDHKRGARRLKTIKHAFEQENHNLSKEELSKFMTILTLMMGIEAMIVTKDVCGLDNEQSSETLSWGIETLMKGIKKG